MGDISREKVRDIIADILIGHCIEITVPDSDVYDAGISEMGVDSLMFIELVIQLEDEYQISVPTTYLSRSEMPTINAITDIIKKVKNCAST